ESSDARKRRRSERAMICRDVSFVDRRSAVSGRWSFSDFSTAFESFAESHHIGVFKIAAHRKTPRDPGHGNAQRLNDFRQIQRRRFAVHRRISRDDYFSDAALFQTFEEFLNSECVRANPIEG